MTSSGLEGLDEEIDRLLSEVHSQERDYAARVETLESEVRLREAELRELEEKLAAAETARAAAEREHSAHTRSLRDALAEREAAASRLALKSEELAAGIVSLEKALERERAASAEKDVYVQSAKSAVKGRDAEVGKVWRMLEEARSELASWKAQTAERDSRLEAVAEENRALALEIQKLNNSLQQAAQGFRHKLDLVKKEAEAAVLEKSSALVRISAAEEAMAERGAALEKLAARARQLEETLAVRESRLAELEDRLKFFETAPQSAEKASAETAALRRKERLVSELTARVASLEKDLASVEEDRARLAESLRQEHIRCSQTFSRAEELSVRCAALEADHEALKKRHYDSIAAKSAEIDRLRSDLALAESEGAKRLSELGEADRRRYHELAGEMQQLSARLAEKEVELEAARSGHGSLTAECARLREHERKLMGKGRGVKTRVELAEVGWKLASKEKELKKLSDKLDSAAAEIAGLRAARESFRGRTAPGASADLQELVAGIAHQISNSVSIIRSHAEYCLEAPREADLKEPLGAIVRSIVTLQKRIEEIADFSRPVLLQRKTVGLGDIAREALASAAKARVRFSFQSKVSAPKDLPPLRVDQVRLQEALEHVLVNAAESLDKDGRITVDVRRSPGGQVIKVSDTGQGVEPKNLPALFEPFFSTKPGRLGLGLAIAKNIIKSHGGEIKISSESGRGTQAEIFLPETPGEG